MKKCNKCGTVNSKDAIFCENCGNKLSESKKVVCQNCGFPNSVEASFCENCGSKLSGVQSSDTISDNNIDNTYEELPKIDNTNKKQKDVSRIKSKNLRRSQGNSKSNNLRNIVVTVAIIIVIVIGAVSLGYFKSNRQTENSRNNNSTVVQKISPIVVRRVQAQIQIVILKVLLVQKRKHQIIQKNYQYQL